MSNTINLSTEITTAARRIARDVNANVQAITRSYDVDGRVIDTHETGMWYVDPATAPEGIAVKLAGRRDIVKGGWDERLTEREAQDRLDAHAAGVDVDTYLEDLDFHRGVER